MFAVTIQLKPHQQYLHMVLSILCRMLPFTTLESVDEILWYDFSNKYLLELLGHYFSNILRNKASKFLKFLLILCYNHVGNKRANYNNYLFLCELIFQTEMQQLADAAAASSKTEKIPLTE